MYESELINMTNKIFDKNEISDKLCMLYDFIGHKIRDDYALTSITCSSYGNEHNVLNQDALAIVGDHVIKLIVTSNTYQYNNSISRKDISNVFQKVETNDNLEKIGIKFNIDVFMLWNNSDLNGDKKRATTIEAIIGAIFLSNGLQYAIEFTEKIGLIEKRDQTILDIIPLEIFEKRLSEMSEYGYQSVVFCIIDAVFSIGANYTSTKRTVERFSKYVGLNITDQYIVSQFVSEFSSQSPEVLATSVFDNKQRTSTTNGILKAEAVVKYLNVLHQFGIETKDDLLRNKENIELKKSLKQIKGQSKLLTFDYALMLSGDTGNFKRDRHIINFFTEYLKVTNLDDLHLQSEFNKQLETVQRRYPDFNMRTLDGVIWQFMSSKK